MKKMHKIACFALVVSGVAFFAAPHSYAQGEGCGFNTAGDYVCEGGNLATPGDPGAPNIPGYDGPGSGDVSIPPVPPYTPGDLDPGDYTPTEPEFEMPPTWPYPDVVAGCRPPTDLPTEPGECGDPSSGWTEEQCRQAAQIAETDNAGPSYCARGVANVLEGMGFGSVGRGVNGDQMGGALTSAGWQQQDCPPESAPNGAVLNYGNSGGTSGGGAQYGHTEIKCTIGGQTVYISDAVRTNWGGTVPGNYQGAWTTGGGGGGGAAAPATTGGGPI